MTQHSWRKAPTDTSDTVYYWPGAPAGRFGVLWECSRCGLTWTTSYDPPAQDLFDGWSDQGLFSDCDMQVVHGVTVG